MHCDEHFGQEGDKLGVSSTKSVVEIWPQRTSYREENTFFVLLIDGMVFLLQDTDLIFHSFQQPPLFQVMAAATDSVDSRKYFSVKKSIRKSGISCSVVCSDSATFVTFSQLWRWWSQKKQEISTPWRPTIPCCLFPCTKMVKLFPFKGNKSWCSSWDRKTARTTSK